MNRKGQIEGVGIILSCFFAIIIGVALYQGTFQSISTATNTVTYVNNSVTLPAVNSTVNLNGQAAYSVILINATSGAVVSSNGYTVNNYVLSNGALTTNIKVLDAGSAYASKGVNASYTSEPFGYETNSGSRAVIGLITVFAALSIAILALMPTLRSDLMNMVRG